MIFLRRFKKYIKVMSGGVYRYTGSDFYEKLLCCIINRMVVLDINLVYDKGALYQAKLNNREIKITFDVDRAQDEYMIRMPYCDRFGKKMVLSIWCQTELTSKLILPYSVNKYDDIISVVDGYKEI